MLFDGRVGNQTKPAGVHSELSLFTTTTISNNSSLPTDAIQTIRNCCTGLADGKYNRLQSDKQENDR